MRAVLPGRPQARLQAVCSGQWEETRLIVYISGNALVILDDANSIVQTIYVEDSEEELHTVTLDEVSGKIAACSGNGVFIYKPCEKYEGSLRWSLSVSHSLDDEHGDIHSLSWGSSEELLLGGKALKLVSTKDDEIAEVWEKLLAIPANIAHFSYDATMIASTGSCDRLVKVWRRLGYGSDDVNFDFTYLSHPGVVTSLFWRKPYHREQTIDNVLYTVCADNILRIWAPTNPHDLTFLQLWGTVNLDESIAPRWSIPDQHTKKRYVFVIHSREFTLATERAIQEGTGSEDDHALQHLVEVANRCPEVVVVLDDKGFMSAWGLENVGCKDKKTTNIFNIAHVEGLKFSFPQGVPPELDYVQFENFCSATSSSLVILAHYFDGRVEWLEGKMDELFDPSPHKNRLRSKGAWSGHSNPVKKLVRTANGKFIVSRTEENEVLVWQQKTGFKGPALLRKSMVDIDDHIHRACILNDGRYVVFLHHDKITLWDVRHEQAELVASEKYSIKGKPLCLLPLLEVDAASRTVHVATMSSKMESIAWEIQLPPHHSGTTNGNFEADTNGHTNGHSRPSLREFARFSLEAQDDFDFVLPVDPVGSASTISGFFDVFARDIAISYTKSGSLSCWTAKVDNTEKSVKWLLTASVETGIQNPSLASGNSIRKVAFVDADKTELTIWDTRGAQLEMNQRYANESIQDLDWTSTPDEQSILAVGFPHRVLLLSQMRYDYLDKGPAWETIREIRIRDLTPHPIGDSVWLSDGSLLVGAGNQLFVYDSQVQLNENLAKDLRLSVHQGSSNELFDVVARLNGPLPVYHPQFLAQHILAGKAVLVESILLTLYKKLRFYSAGEPLDSFLNMELTSFYTETEMKHSERGHVRRKASYVDYSDDAEDQTFGDEVAATLIEKMTTLSIPQLTSAEQIHLANTIECVAEVSKHKRSMDENASRYMLFFRSSMLSQSLRHQPLSWREIVWAFHSESQEIIVDLVQRHFQGRMQWSQAKQTGIFMWMKDLTSLRVQFENMAKNHYTATDEKNPVDCSLYYLALKKKNVLVGLWRMANWNREQKFTQKFLMNNFSEPRWKTAALKNAYALMSKHRFEYAAAFFLLADRLKDAVNVCITQLKDIQLAITITRVYEGDDSPILKEILEEYVLPQAANEGNRWMATWAFWMLHRRDMAVRVLVSPVYDLVTTPGTPGLDARLFLSDDPALSILYKQLREKTLQTIRGTSRISPKIEWQFILHNARLYDRMGCDVLALDLVRNWKFLQPTSNKDGRQAGRIGEGMVMMMGDSLTAPEMPFVLSRRKSLVVQDMPNLAIAIPQGIRAGVGITGSFLHGDGSNHSDKENEEDKEKEKGKEKKKQPPPTQFVEPDASSLLDSFGF